MSVVSVTELIEAVTVVADPATTFNENIKQVGGTAVATGVGASDAGTMRVALSSDSQVAPNNVTQNFKDEFATFDTTNTWDSVVGSGDIVQLDGNASGISYLVISKDPLSTGQTTTITTKSTFTGNSEISAGLSISQRVLGQECSIEWVSNETATPVINDISISSISQSTTTLTVTTATAHGLQAGMRIGINGVTSDSRLNYPTLVIASVPSSTMFTCTAGPMGAIASLTVGPYNNQGTVYYRPAIGYANEGFSQVFENTTISQSTYYVRTAEGDVYPSGSFGANQSANCGSTASIQQINGAGVYAFMPTNEYRFSLTNDKLAFYDVVMDALASQPVTRAIRTSYVPDPNKNYYLRFRFVNDKALTVPTAKIVSAAKSASATATITTATAHGLTTGDYIVIYGIRDGTNFAPQTTPVQVLSTPTTTSLTVTFGATATATSYGGFVSRANGGNVPAGFAGAGSGAAVQSVAVSATQVTLVTSGTWSVSIGDYVNLYGIRNITSGADLGVDGVYRVFNISGTSAAFEPIGGTVLPTPFSVTNSGGAVIKRTDVRIPYVRIFDYLRERVELLNRNDFLSAAPVLVNGGTIGTVSAVSSAYLAYNRAAADITSAAITTTGTSASITPAEGTLSNEFNVIVTAVSGTNPTLDVVVQESDDSGTNWYDTYHFPRITATGQYRSPLIPLTGNRVRYVRTVAGTSPSFTNAVSRLQSQTSNPVQRQFFDRSVVPNTLNSTTPSFFTEGCVDINVVVVMGAVTTTAPVLVYETSPDNLNWVQLGADITTAANTNNILQVSNAQARFSRLRVKTAGSGATLGYVMVKGVGK